MTFMLLLICHLRVISPQVFASSMLLMHCQQFTFWIRHCSSINTSLYLLPPTLNLNYEKPESGHQKWCKGKKQLKIRKTRPRTLGNNPIPCTILLPFTVSTKRQSIFPATLFILSLSTRHEYTYITWSQEKRRRNPRKKENKSPPRKKEHERSHRRKCPPTSRQKQCFMNNLCLQKAHNSVPGVDPNPKSNRNPITELKPEKGQDSVHNPHNNAKMLLSLYQTVRIPKAKNRL